MLKKIDSTVTEDYDTGQWTINNYRKFHYDENNLISTHFYGWIENEKRYVISKDEYTYDGNGRLSTTIRSNSYFDDRWLTEREYNVDGKLIEQRTSYWDSVKSIWDIQFKYENEYDANKNLTKSTYLQNISGNWEEVNKGEYEYDGNNKIINKTNYEWSEGSNKWDISSKIEYYYDKDETLSKINEQYWYTPNNQFEQEYKSTFIYDANKNIKIINNYIRILGDTSWSTMDKYEYIYDLNTPSEDVLIPTNSIAFSFDLFEIHNKILERNRSKLNRFGEWEITGNKTFYYTICHGARINKANFVSTNVYPNPASDIVNFDLSNISSATSILIFDINGKQVANYDINGNNSAINISQLTSGFYMYKIIGNDLISSGKLVKE